MCHYLGNYVDESSESVAIARLWLEVNGLEFYCIAPFEYFRHLLEAETLIDCEI